MSDPGGSPGQPPAALQIDWDLLDIAQKMAVTTPGFIAMRRDPDLHAWTADLVRFGDRDDLRPLGRALQHIASGISAQNAFASLMPTLSEDSADVDLQTLARASKAAEEAVTQAPYASFMLAWAALCLWILGAPRHGEQLYGEKDPWHGWPHPGWGPIPAACIGAAIKLQGLYASRLLAEEAYAVLQASWRRHPGERDALEPAIARYRQLAATIANRYDGAVGSLADDLLEACGDPASRIRQLLAALLWSLGLVPECHAFLANPGLPGRGTLRRLVQRSMQCVPEDPLIQYLWLEIKDNPGIDLRAHETLFALINHRWNQWWMDDGYSDFGLSAGPSVLYARVLTALLAGHLDEAGAAEYLQAYDLIVDGRLPLPGRGFVLHRMHMLRHLIGERFDYYGPEVSEEERVAHLKERVEGTARGREQAERHPEFPDILGRTSVATFELIERCLADNTRLGSSERERCVMVLETLERFRTGALAYWLRVNRPLVSAADNRALQELLDQERRLLERLRGAYFIALRTILPLHYSWSDLEIGDLMALNDPAERKRFYSADVAREAMEEAERGLTALCDGFEGQVPEYAERRRAPTTNLERLVATLNQHTGGSRAS